MNGRSYAIPQNLERDLLPPQLDIERLLLTRPTLPLESIQSSRVLSGNIIVAVSICPTHTPRKVVVPLLHEDIGHTAKVAHVDLVALWYEGLERDDLAAIFEVKENVLKFVIELRREGLVVHQNDVGTLEYFQDFLILSHVASE